VAVADQAIQAVQEERHLVLIQTPEVQGLIMEVSTLLVVVAVLQRQVLQGLHQAAVLLAMAALVIR
jgi:hypothetical protein